MSYLAQLTKRVNAKKAEAYVNASPLFAITKGIMDSMQDNNFELVQKSWADYWAKHPDHHKAAEALGAAAHAMGVHAGQGTMPTNAQRDAHMTSLAQAETTMGATKAKYLSDAAHKLGEKHGNAVNKYNEGTKKGKFMVEPHAHPYPHRPDIKANDIPLHGQKYGHYHNQSNDSLDYTRKDAREAADAMKGHNPQKEGAYADQAFAAGDILRWRAKNGIQK
jgi:hypothetical protein